MVLYITNVGAIALCDTLVDAVDVGATNATGRILIYDATGGVPANADVAITGQVLLATLNFQQPAFGGAVDNTGSAIATRAGSIADETSAVAGTAAFFRVTDRNNLAIWQGAVGSGSGELDLNSVVIGAGATVSITAMTVTMPES